MGTNKDMMLKNKVPNNKTKFRNFPMVPRVIYGAGCFDQIGEILLPRRISADAPMIYLMDDVFKGRGLAERIPLLCSDQIIFISADQEPKTEQVDRLVSGIRDTFAEQPSGIIGIGGGTLLDLAKAVSIMLTNSGSAANYQGWDLVKKPSVYHVGVPTISGTGAEVSRTTVLLGPDKKLGINSDFTTFDQVILDPDLSIGVPKDQWFYTGMDCYIHCVESLSGTFLNAFSQSYGEKALELCKEVFLGNLPEEVSREKLMMASWHGGMSIAYSQVGVAHAMSYGLSYVLGIKHGLGNCLVFQHLQEFYPEGVQLFHKMRELHGIQLPRGICSNLDDEDLDAMISVAMSLVPLWENALGPLWKQQVSADMLREIYRKI